MCDCWKKSDCIRNIVIPLFLKVEKPNDEFSIFLNKYPCFNKPPSLPQISAQPLGYYVKQAPLLNKYLSSCPPSLS